uniref:Uncharacterized protein n=1 Tax=Prymnesium polylepis TaxID=72548 RepID=A0A6T7ZBA7_9EUKA
MTTMISARGFFIRAVAVGNSGFDPLGLSSPETLVPLRQAEIKHGRLAMLAAVAWPMQEMLHPLLARASGARSLLPDGLSPTALNGGLEQPEVAPAIAFGFSVMMMAEFQDIRKRATEGLKFNEWAEDSVAGDLDYDPLGIAMGKPATERFELQEAEMLNGRLAMLAVVAYITSEVFLGVPIMQ